MAVCNYAARSGEKMQRNTDWEKFTYQVISGEAGGKILFQPRILCWYSDKLFSSESMGEFDGCSLADIYKRLDISNRIYDYGACIQRVVEDKRIIHGIKNISDWEREFTISTPVGDMSMRLIKNKSNGGEFYSKWWVETPEDLKVYTYYEQASDWKYYPEIYGKIRAEWGSMGAPTLCVPRTSIMHAYLDTMGVEQATYALSDEPQIMAEYFNALHDSTDRYIKTLNSTDIKMVNYGDNVHCGLVSPKLFEKYLLPEYIHRSSLLHKSGKFLTAHWDGDTKAILKYARQTGLDGIEAITPKPQGDVTLEEIKEGLGDMFLVDGIASLLFAKPYTEEQLVDDTKKLIKLFAPKLIVGISDEMASFGDMERVKIVKQIVEDYNKSLKEV